MSSKVRYIQGEGEDQFVSEKDFPMGTMRIETILLALTDWNIEDEKTGKKAVINNDNLKDLVDPKRTGRALRSGAGGQPHVGYRGHCRPKKRLRAILTPQFEALAEELTHRQFVRGCIAEGLPS